MEKILTENEMLQFIKKDWVNAQSLCSRRQAFEIVVNRLLDEVDTLQDVYHPEYLNWMAIRDLKANIRTEMMGLGLLKEEEISQRCRAILSHIELMLPELISKLSRKQ